VTRGYAAPTGFSGHLMKEDPLPPPWLASACAFIEAHAADFTSVAEIAAAVGVDDAQLCRNFEFYFGFTPTEYLVSNAASADGPPSRCEPP
jgi:methylphosphotriester-DNA--protein-cysteine methyltransferase